MSFQYMVYPYFFSFKQWACIKSQQANNWNAIYLSGSGQDCEECYEKKKKCMRSRLSVAAAATTIINNNYAPLASQPTSQPAIQPA